MVVLDSRPLISVAMPVYNGSRYLKQAIESVLQQTFQNFEIVIVNDGSTDRGQTAAIAASFASPKIKFIEQENRGVGGALNTAVANLSGDVFCWLSHDDLYLPHKLERQVEFFNCIGKTDAVLFSDYFLIDASGNQIDEIRLPHEKFLEKPMLGLLNAGINGCTLFIPLPVLRKFGPFDETLKHTQDYDLWNRMIDHHPFFHQPETLVKYRLHAAQDSKRPEAATEGDRLWMSMLDARSAQQRAMLFGSTRRFYEEMASFLGDRTPYQGAAKYADKKSRQVTGETLVSVIVPAGPDREAALSSLRSALQQSHSEIEVILVCGPGELAPEYAKVAESDRRLRVLSRPESDLAPALDQGMQVAAGEYIAFLERGDVFAREKVARQMASMQSAGALFSHTSYRAVIGYASSDRPIVHSGRFTGAVYPHILAGCPIATSTVMLHRLLADSGIALGGFDLAARVMFWISIAEKYGVLGIDEPLCILRWDEDSPATDPEATLAGYAKLLSALSSHPLHSQHTAEIASLCHAYNDFVEFTSGDGLLTLTG
jgi:hypothetical protein